MKTLADDMASALGERIMSRFFGGKGGEKLKSEMDAVVPKSIRGLKILLRNMPTYISDMHGGDRPSAKSSEKNLMKALHYLELSVRVSGGH